MSTQISDSTKAISPKTYIDLMMSVSPRALDLYMVQRNMGNVGKALDMLVADQLLDDADTKSTAS